MAPSPRPSSWAAAALGAVAGAAAVGVWARRRDAARKGARRRRPSADDSDAISVEGSVMVTLPPWAVAASADYFSRRYYTDDEMMSLAIHLSDRNITEGTGGPFGSAIFERHPELGYSTLVSVGVNRVVPLGNSMLHGETVAIQLAQRRMGSYTLCLDRDGAGGDDGLFYEDDGDVAPAAPPTICPPVSRKRRFELFTSCEPCAMCLGATLWSGVSRIVCGATKSDAQAIGFDEGPVYERSYRHLEECGVEVKRNVMTEEAAGVLRRYGDSGPIYNR